MVVGGGINGVGIARDLAGRGWSVMLVEQDDLAAHTSSSSTKLIHGGLRYLEYNEFGLVRKALQEREGLLKSAPHIMWPLRFVIPHDAFMRPAWLIRLGLFFYDHLAKRELLAASTSVNLRTHALGASLQPRFKRGFVYSDGWVDDARLVVLNAIDAHAHGAHILTRVRCMKAQRTAKHWLIELQQRTAGAATPATAPGYHVRARALVNAAGPWAEQFLRQTAQAEGGQVLATRSLRLVKGSHIVVPRCFDHDHAYLFQNADKRIIFAIPYEGAFTLIGTTDEEVQGDPRDAKTTTEEVAYLCEQASRYLLHPITPSEVVWSYVGVRPLLDDASSNASAVTRDYLLEANHEGAPLLSVWGGKITTFRKLAEDAANDVGRMLGDARQPWTQGAFLPGGDLQPGVAHEDAKSAPKSGSFDEFVQLQHKRYPWLDQATLHRMVRAYGSRLPEVLGQAQRADDLGAEVAPGLFDAELCYLQAQEWACEADDVLWRRSKLGLHYTPAQRQQVAQWPGWRETRLNSFDPHAKVAVCS